MSDKTFKKQSCISRAILRLENIKRFSTLGLIILLSLGGGCVSPIALHHGIINYDQTITDVEMEMLLLNIARARHHYPLHFTVTSNVAATFDFRTTGGVFGDVVGESIHPPVKPIFSVTAAESPTISIIPIQGEEFAQRVLTPGSEDQFEFLYHRGIDLQLLLRLMADRIVIHHDGEDTPPTVFPNQPDKPKGYREFRRRILHLSGLHHEHQLYIGRILFREVWPLPTDHPLTSQALDREYEWEKVAKNHPPVLSRKVLGRVAITNYDPTRLSNEERHQLHEEAQQYPLDAVLVDIHPDHPGGDYPLYGHIQLRSFEEVIRFIAQGIEEEREFVVDPDPRSAPVRVNPAQTLSIVETSKPLPNAAFTTRFAGRWYSIQEEPENIPKFPHWNMKAFRLLHQWFQLTVTDVKHIPTLPITIGK